MTKRNVMICISTSRIEVGVDLFDSDTDEVDEEELTEEPTGEMPEPTDLLTEGRLVTSPTRVELIYDETEFSGMEGSVTSIGFDRLHPEMISMMRSGPVSTAMIFEEGKRHMSVFDTPFSSFQICTRTLHVENKLLTDGTIFLEYIIEIHGAQAERCRMQISVRNDEKLF